MKFRSLLWAATVGAAVAIGVFYLSHESELKKAIKESEGQTEPFQKVRWELARLADPNTGQVPPLGKWHAYQQLVQQGKLPAGPFQAQTAMRTAEWQLINDFFPTLAITKMVYDPNNTQTFYFCTGEGWYGLGMVAGMGVWKSTDGGSTWHHLSSTATPAFSYCQDIDVHPVSGHVYVATLYGGLQRSTDGGLTWQRVLNPPGSLNKGVCDVEITKNGNLFAATGIFVTGSIYYSETGDSGTWVKITGGFPQSGIYRIELATAPSNDNVIYAVACNTTTYAIQGMYKSVDKGASWIKLPLPGGIDTAFARFQAWYNLVLAVDPGDENHVVGGGIHLWRSRDGGFTWQRLSHGKRDSTGYQYVHVDQHAIVFRNRDTVYFGNDGGVWKCDNFQDSLPHIYERNYGYRVTQFYAGALHPAAGHQTAIGGTQDNGSNMVWMPGIAPVHWLTNWDGGYCAINQKNPDVMFTTKNSNGVFRYTQGGWNEQPDTLTNLLLQNHELLFINPIALDPANQEILYQVSDRGLWRLSNASTATADQWVQASKPMVAQSAIGVSYNEPHTVYVGRALGGNIYRLERADTSNAASSYRNCDPKEQLPSGTATSAVYCNHIFVDPDDVNHVLVAYTNYGIKNIWETHNAKADTPLWVAHDGDLPDLPVFWIQLHPLNKKVCYIGTELGVFYTNELKGDQTIWLPCNHGLANVRVTQLVLRTSDLTMLATTYGRGLYMAKLPLQGPDYALQWTEHGPLDVGGRTRTIMIDPNDPSGQTIWAGAVSGGLWRISGIDALPAVGMAAAQHEPVSLKIVPTLAAFGPVRIEFFVNKAATVTLAIFHSDGRLAHLFTQHQAVAAGKHLRWWHPADHLPNGVYFVVLQVGNQRQVGRLLLMRGFRQH
ncbi:MAG: hypothetical protein NZL95_05605 [Chitinophagales bacterium]|nr:hypothetical protein [Chitinophagales bacterium]MDW8428009.1 hypothetical protein [Chitinophagales bacterium]